MDRGSVTFIERCDARSKPHNFSNGCMPNSLRKAKEAFSALFLKPRLNSNFNGNYISDSSAARLIILNTELTT